MFKRYVEVVLNMNNKWRVWRHCTCVRLLYWLIDYISVIRREFRSTFGPYGFVRIRVPVYLCNLHYQNVLISHLVSIAVTKVIWCYIKYDKIEIDVDEVWRLMDST